MMKTTQGRSPALPRRMKLAVVLGAIGLALSGCVVYPSSYGYNNGGYYGGPAYYAPPVVISGGFGYGYGGGWGRRGWR